MNQLIDDILSEMKLKHGVTKFELEKIIDSQFKVLQTSIQNKDLRRQYERPIFVFEGDGLHQILRETTSL